MGLIRGWEASRLKVHPRLREVIDKLDSGNYHPWISDDKIQSLKTAEGYVWQLDSAFRSVTQQNIEYAKGRTEVGQKTTNLQGGDSLHQWGLAVDLKYIRPQWGYFTIDGVRYNFYDKATFIKFGLPDFYKLHGLEWGGNWTDIYDPGHVELKISRPSDLLLSGTPWWEKKVEAVVKPKISKLYYIYLAVLAVIVASVIGVNKGGKK